MSDQMTNRSFGKGFFSDILLKIRLTISLMKDNRVPFWLKAIPVFSLLYLIVPIDLLFGPIDDAIIIYIGIDLFIDLCPPEIVREHLDKLEGGENPPDKGEIVDSKFRD